MKIFFDMDGTIANLYGVKNWLPMLIAENTKPYAEAKPMVNMNALARVLNRLQKQGNEIGIISWTSKGGSTKYNEAVAKAKKAWLNKHLASVKFNEIHIVAYGTPKQTFANAEAVLFDDEEPNRTAWTGKAFNAEAIIETLKTF